MMTPAAAHAGRAAGSNAGSDGIDAAELSVSDMSLSVRVTLRPSTPEEDAVMEVTPPSTLGSRRLVSSATAAAIAVTAVNFAWLFSDGLEPPAQGEATVVAAAAAAGAALEDVRGLGTMGGRPAFTDVAAMEASPKCHSRSDPSAELVASVPGGTAGAPPSAPTT